MGYIKSKIHQMARGTILRNTSEIADEVNRISNILVDLQQKNGELENKVGILKEHLLDMHSIACYSAQTEMKPQKREDILNIEECYKYLEKDIPHAYAIYKELMDNNKKIYVGEPIHSCSVEGHIEAERFKTFLQRFLRGYILDIGCGTQDVPLYLEDYDLDKIYGLDPLPPSKEHPFEFEQGIGEFIPWKNASFDCVIFATSLDHVFLLDKVLSEVKRVLVRGG